MPGSVVVVRVLRSGVEESLHLGSVAVADAAGRLVALAGDPERVVFVRSALKPIQAAVSLSLIGEDLPDAEVAVMAGSHNGEPVHLQAVGAILERAGLGVEALRCPPDLPLDAEEARAASGPRPELHNCSGKHAGMLLACVRGGLDPAAYPEPDHPLQAAVLDAVRASAGQPSALGVDGCGVPVPAMPLSALATMYARLVRPDGLGDLSPVVRGVATAMRAEPYLVAGRDRVCTRVMEAIPETLVKVGAEGVLCASLEGPGLGVALKIEDGAGRARPPVLLRVLRELGVAGGERELADLARPAVLGGGRPVGELAADFDLVRA